MDVQKHLKEIHSQKMHLIGDMFTLIKNVIKNPLTLPTNLDTS